VGPAAGTRHTHEYANTHAQVEEHHGEGDYTRPTGANEFSAVLNNLNNQGGMEGAALEARKANDGKEGEAVEKNRQQRKGRTSLSGGYAEVVRSLEHVRTSQHMSGKKQTPGPERRPGDARGTHRKVHSSRWEAMGRGAGPRERQPREYNKRDRRVSQRSVKNDDSSKYCVREGASVAMHLQRVTARHLYRWLQEAEGHSGPRGSWQSSISRREQSSPALGVPHAFRQARQARSYSLS
jgi:hypothetical protein